MIKCPTKSSIRHSTMADLKMKRRFCYVIIAILLVVLLYTLSRSDKKLQVLRTGRKGSLGTRSSESNKQGQSIHEVYDGVQTLLIFIGYPRSGHTLVSSLLDAHPHVIIANEFDIIGKWQEWDASNRNKYYLFDQLYLNSEKEADVGYRSATVKHRYSYHVPRQWQGTYNGSILVMGAKKGGKTTRLLFKSENMNVLKEFQQVLKIAIKYVHVIRNPYDNIATMLLRALKKRAEASKGSKINDTRGLDEQIDKYFNLVRLNNKLNTHFEGRVHLIHSSQLIREPGKTLLGVCQFLQLNCDQQYIKDCSSIIYKEATKTRYSVVWTEEQKELVREKLQKFPSLKGYNFDN